MFAAILIIIALISVLLALLSLRNLRDKSELKKASKELLRGRVVYSKDHSSSSSSLP